MGKGLQIALAAAVLLLAVAVAGLGAFVFFGPGAVQAEPVKPSEPVVVEAVDLTFFNTKEFMTDLADKDRMRYVGVTISLGLTSPEAAEKAKRFEPKIRDVVLSLLRQRTAAELAGAAGKEALAKAILDGLREELPGLHRVYVTDLVVQ